MNKKEILEIRKQLTPQNCALTRIRACYVDGEKTKKFTTKDSFLSLPEEEAFKYFEIFRKALSGSVGKNLFEMSFPLEEEFEEGKQTALLALRDNQLEDDEMAESFFDRFIENYEEPGNYYIILVHGNYDIPGRASDGTEMFDASENVYSFIQTCVCPVNLAKSALTYNSENNRVEERVRDWIVEMPSKAFLFPLFNDRAADIHGILYYSKKAEDIQPSLIENLLGASQPLTPQAQKEGFNNVLSTIVGDTCDYETVQNIHENLHDMIEESKESPDPLTLTGPEVKRLLTTSGIPEEKMESFDKCFEEIIGPGESLLAENLTNTKSFKISSPDVEIKVSPDRLDLIETRQINGRTYLLIAADEQVEVNGEPVRFHTEDPDAE